MNKGLTLATGLGLGAGIMYLLDPDRGRRRRALLRDKCAWSARRTGEIFEGTARDLRNRTQGIVAELQSRFSSAPVDDGVLVDRVRSQLGHIVPHPAAIQVTAQNGKVTLSGPIVANKIDRLLSCVRHVKGVNEVVNNLGGA